MHRIDRIILYGCKLADYLVTASIGTAVADLVGGRARRGVCARGCRRWHLHTFKPIGINVRPALTPLHLHLSVGCDFSSAIADRPLLPI